MGLIKDYIFNQVAQKKLDPQDAKSLLKELQSLNKNVKDEEIAIIGMAGRYPSANSIDEYWSLLRNGVNGITSFPEQRSRDVAEILAVPYFAQLLLGRQPPSEEELSVLLGAGGYLDAIDTFDAAFFRISPREATYMDPWQRVFLETAYQAIEDAGYGGDKIVGTRTGVFVGKDHTNMQLYKMVTEPDAMHLTGSWTGILASRLSYIFNLQGPSQVIDTACSSGLVAIHEACQALRNKECEMAVAGGINLSFLPLINPDGDMKMVETSETIVRTFDKEAKGTLWSEGVGALLLKPLSKAIADGDPIHAVIKGSATNNDGASNGITAPNASAQEDLIVQAWKNAKVNAETIRYVEAHGTGTVIGDPIEVKALTEAFRRFTDRQQFCGIGSVKTNIGHAVGASGLASITKVILALRHRELPPSLHFQTPNPYISFTQTPLYVNDTIQPLVPDSDKPLRAGVSSFGFSGTNCHIVLEEAPARKGCLEEESGALRLFVLSARQKELLVRQVEQYKRYLEREPHAPLADICFTVATGRGHYSHRLALLVESTQDLYTQLTQFLQMAPTEWNGERSWYGVHQIVHDQKVRAEGDLSQQDKRQLNHSAREEAIQSNLKGVARCYAAGADIEWEMLYPEGQHRRLSLPTYPLARTRYWASVNQVHMPDLAQAKAAEHPLLDRCMADSIDQTIYTTTLHADRLWVLNEHRLQTHPVMPGVAFLEVVLGACREQYGEHSYEFRDVLFLAPLVVPEGESLELQTVLTKEMGGLHFRLVSKQDTNWLLHAEGQVTILNQTAPAVPDTVAIRRRCSQEANEVRPADAMRHFHFGPRWSNMADIKVGEGEYLVHLKLPEQFLEDLDGYTLYPALLDNALNVPIHLDREGHYIPFAFKSFVFYRPLPHRFYSHIVKHMKEGRAQETKSFDITLFDESGQVLATATQYTIKLLKEVDEHRFLSLVDAGTALHELTWIPQDLDNAVYDLPLGVTMVLHSGSAWAAQWTDALRESGRRVLEGRTLAIADGEPVVEIVLLDTEEDGIESLYTWYNSWLARSERTRIHLIVPARNVSKVTGEERSLHPYAAGAFGLAKGIAQEQANFRVTCLDVDERTPVANLLAELGRPEQSAYRLTAYRNGRRYVQQLQRVSPKGASSITLHEGAVYVITGGLGGLGLEVAEHFSSMKKIKLALLSRTPLPESDQFDISVKARRSLQAIHEMREHGIEVVPYACDVADEHALREVLQQIRTDLGPIKGIVHAAGVAGEGLLVRKQEGDFRQVVSPKVDGTVNLDRLTQQDDLDFFVLFSSVTALTGGIGQADYTAANSFLDAFAAARQHGGKSTLSIGWSSWSETGMAVEYHVAQEERLFKPLLTAKALHLLDLAMAQEKAHLLAGEMSLLQWARFEGDLPFLLSPDILLQVQRRRLSANAARQDTKAYREVVLTGRHDGEYTLFEQELGRLWGGALGFAEISVYDNFYTLGGDSILAVKLVSAISDHLHMDLEVSDLFDHPTLNELAQHLESLGVVMMSEPAELFQPSSEQAQRLETAANDEENSDSVPHKNLTDQAYVDSPGVELISDLSWRQLNCYDRGLALQFGLPNARLIPYFFLWLGLKRGFNLTDQGYPYSFSTEEKVFGYATDHQLLAKFGMRVQLTTVPELSGLHDAVCSLVEGGRLVLVCFDEFYMFYSPYYRKEHNDHLTVINGYNRQNGIYQIVNHSHLHLESPQKVSYGPFHAQFGSLEEIYADLPLGARVLVSLEPIPGVIVEEASLRTETLEILRLLLATGQSGRDFDLAAELVREGRMDGDALNELYIVLGAKELFADTLLRRFCPEMSTVLRPLADELVLHSNKLVNKYTTGIYRKRPLRAEDVESSQAAVSFLLQEMLTKAIQAIEAVDHSSTKEGKDN
ncbi:SDR family NAD(P)-dependent oxidoreductase [Brevibacillus brevis]|uniref:SDR family NAD(P)-dependent oxidoreductase n=1 Tax=Brevibacillus brevis TaxID=1393 RepID=UPI000D0FC161|nr:SDR family NAD(P)-dependent oxidoreductase [Brevibacillus brevis]PSJ63216.1 hypothetical protein C7J99_31555 [Brevibacillus brevis]RED35851.1 butirosin biosynthesis protein H-like [Brevibacillus brevis]GEC93049.1 hypothetical protein BBR01nite_53800 [Brevibacillus brevis]VEF89040.1 Polyketide synthase PksM [Brevibacillus brevis]